MAGDIPCVGEDVVEDPRKALRVVLVTARLGEVLVEYLSGVFHISRLDEVLLMSELTCKGVAESVVTGDLVAEALDPRELHLDVTADGGRVSVVLGVNAVVHVPKRVGRGLLDRSDDVLAVAAVRHRRLSVRRESTAVGRTDTVILGRGPVEVETCADVLGDLGGKTRGDGLTDEGVTLDEVGVVSVGSAEEVVHTLCSSGDVEGVVLLDTGLLDIVVPVSDLTLLVVLEFEVAHPGCRSLGKALTVVDHLDVVLSVTELGGVVLLNEGDSTAEVDHRLSDLSLL